MKGTTPGTVRTTLWAVLPDPGQLRILRWSIRAGLAWYEVFHRPPMTYSRVLEWLFRLVLAGAFFVAGFEKARDPIQFLFDIRSFHLLPDPYAALVALALPWLEGPA